MDNKNNIYFRYFVYSSTQANEIRKIQSSMSSEKPKLGTVIVNGIAKQYTEQVRDLSQCRYSDSKVVTKGDKRYIKHTPAQK